MSDKIVLQNMMFYGFHGVHEHEKKFGQRLYIDVELLSNLKHAGQTDNLLDTIDYTAIYDQIKNIAENQQFNLLEALGEHITQAILECAAIEEVIVRIRKPAVPIAGQLDYVQVQLTRRREQ